MKELLDKLHSNEWFGISNEIEIAKGKHEIVLSFKEMVYKIKRIWQKSE